MALDRTQQIKLAEQVRSTLVEVVKRSPEPMTVRELCEDSKVRYHFANNTPELGYIDRLSRDLHQLGIFRRMYVSRPGQNSRYAYEHTGKEFSPTERRVSAVVRAMPSVPADVKILATKSGALRVSFRGISIEIAVEQ